MSTENQEAEGTSLETQERACLAKASELAGAGNEVASLREVYSGLSLERPQLNKLREWIRAGHVKAVVVYAADRLARDGLHLLLLVEEIEKAGATLAFVTEPHQSTPEGQLLTFVRGWASKLEALKIKERTVRGRKERARKGLLPCGHALYGYLYMKGKGVSRGIRVPDTEKAQMVRDIFTWFTQEGLSLRAVSRRLTALGVASPEGKAKWGPEAIRYLLSNPAYTGRTLSRWGGETIDVVGATPALISPETLEAAQERLRLNQEYSRRNGRRHYPLSGLAFCGVCGARLVGVATKDRRYYRCWRGKEARSHSSYTNAARLEGAAWEAVKSILGDPALVRAQVARHQNTTPTTELEGKLKTAENRLAALVRGEEAIARAMRRGELSEDAASAQLREGRRDREALERECAALKRQLEAAGQWERLDLERLCAQAREWLEVPTPELQRLGMEALGVKVKVAGQDAQVSLALPLDVSFVSSGS